jgi:hypothetical protein
VGGTPTDRQTGDLISLTFPFKESRPKTNKMVYCQLLTTVSKKRALLEQKICTNQSILISKSLFVFVVCYFHEMHEKKYFLY